MGPLSELIGWLSYNSTVLSSCFILDKTNDRKEIFLSEPKVGLYSYVVSHVSLRDIPLKVDHITETSPYKKYTRFPPNIK